MMTKMMLPSCFLAFGVALVATNFALAGTIWDGGGATKDIATAANWDADTTPNLTGGSSLITFGTGGDVANVNSTNVNVAGIVFNRDAAFSFANGTGAGQLTIGASGVNAAIPNSTSRTYTISERNLNLAANQTWTTTNNGAGVTSLTVSPST